MRVDVADDAAQPALGAHLFRLAGVPDVHAAEVGTVGRRVADAVDDGNLAGVVKRLDLGQGRVECELVVDGQRPVRGDANGGPTIVITPIIIRDDGIEVVVAAGKLNDDEDGVLGGAGHGVATPWSGDGRSLAQCTAVYGYPRLIRAVPMVQCQWVSSSVCHLLENAMTTTHQPERLRHFTEPLKGMQMVAGRRVTGRVNVGTPRRRA